MRILFAGNLSSASASGRQRKAALESLGHEAISFPFDGYDRMSALARKVRRSYGGPYFRQEDLQAFGTAFVNAVRQARAEIVWVEKPLMLLPYFIEQARSKSPGSLFVCFQDDDPFGMRKQERPAWKHFIDAIPSYDVHFVKKQANVDEFRAHGAVHVLLFMHGVFSPLFYPRVDTPEWSRRDVTFVGTPLDHRVAHIDRLLRLGVPLHVYGNRWRRHRVYYAHPRHFHPAVEGQDYATLLSGSRICLGFVSSSNRDEYSMRSFEIPGCRSMLLAERTPVHQELYEEGLEAEFFDSPDECASKCSFYLRNEPARQRLARAGYDRCQRSGYLLNRRLQGALEQLKDIRRGSGLQQLGEDG